MSNQFQLDDLRRILKECGGSEPGHHLGYPFMSAYQIAIQFAVDYPGHHLVKLGLGGQGHGPHSLARAIAWFLAGVVKDQGKASGVEGGFISHDFMGEDPWFDHPGGKIRPSAPDRHSIFRWVPRPSPTGSALGG